MTTVPVRQRIEARVVRWLSCLSPRTQLRLSRRPPVVRDGQTLEPDVQLLLAMMERRGRPPYEEMTLAEAREELRAGALVGGGSPVPVAEVRSLTVADGLPARLYVPREPGGAHPLIVFLHGGGFVLGDLDSHDAPCRLLARHAGALVLSIDYRLAPEAPFPGPVEDAAAALGWAIEHAAELGGDPQRVAIAGDSAGGNLAAVASWQAARDGGRSPALQILIYPATDFVAQAPSHTMFDEGFLLVRRDMDWFSAQYLGGTAEEDPRASILRADDLTGLPPAIVVTAGFDPLRDEGEAYAARLREAGGPVLLRRFPGLIHGFINLTAISPSSRDAWVEVAGMARAQLAR
ncbi:MAG TPA: alpha/beta hydrolase [Solirubrobacteraceae bacterium]|nr:alpha/beta hydrolase [Solirubrobacteraceae bacterium]